MNDLKALCTFKNQIKKWIPKECLCHLYKAFVLLYFCTFVEASEIVSLL